MYVNDVMLRDGLQLEETILTVEQKEVLAKGLIDAHIRTIEFGSFVHPQLVPQMANSGALFKQLYPDEKVDFISLVPNLKGVEMAYEHGVKIVNYVFSASNTHNMQNVRQTTEHSLDELTCIQSFCVHNKIELRVSIATTFGCPFEGQVSQERIIEIIEQLQSNQIEYITLADTTGVANPKQVYDLLGNIRKRFPSITFNMHFHNTRGLGLANVLASLSAGVIRFDAALGGLGGCPFAPGATGNISTEDLIHMLHEMGVETGIDLDLLLETSKHLRNYLGHNLDSSVFWAGKATRKYNVEDM